ncbi:MAG: T9SS type A sorting domain-containing protein [Bacteroidales bacterium]|nr:T9SS type A sorting domain-containing protein [Bacteroidales bacterium]
MKKYVLFLSLAVMPLLCKLQAQYNYIDPPDSSEYDLLYVFDTNYIVSCFLTDNPATTYFENPVTGTGLNVYKYGHVYSKFEFYNKINQEWCNPAAPLPDGYVIGANTYNNSHYAEAFAQEYTFQQGDIPYNDYVVVGVAIKIGISALDNYRSLCVLNQNFDTVSKTIFHTVNKMTAVGWNEYITIPWNRGGWNTYYFPQEDYDSLRNINDFRLAFDVPMFGDTISQFHVIHTCNVYSPCIRDSINSLGGPYQAGLHYDTIFMGLMNRFQNVYNDFILNPYEPGAFYQAYLEYMKQFDEDDHVPLCSFPDPKYLKHNGEWVEFSEDPVYEIWRNIYIAMVPIIMVPQNSQSLTEVELQKMCYLVPNPTRDYFKALSHYTINSVQVFDLAGKLLIEEKLNHFEALIDVSDFTAGTYIVKINTVKGSVEKKMIVQ